MAKIAVIYYSLYTCAQPTYLNPPLNRPPTDVSFLTAQAHLPARRKGRSGRSPDGCACGHLPLVRTSSRDPRARAGVLT